MDQIHRRFAMALEAASMAVWDSTIVNGKIRSGVIRWSAEGALLLGREPRPFEQAFREFELHILKEDREHVIAALQDAVDRKQGYELEYRLGLEDGGIRWVSARARIVFSKHGAPVGTLGLIGDITARVEADNASLAREKLAETTLRAIGDAVIRTDGKRRTTFMNRAAEILTGWAADEARGVDILRVLPLVHEKDDELIEHPVRQCLRQQRTVGISHHTQLVTREGRRIDVEDSAAPIWSTEGALSGAVVVLRDVSHERRMANQLAWQAKHDSLTGLINRVEFERVVGEALNRAKEEAQVHACLYMDLDRFKVVNDTCGHAAGDSLLKLLSKRLHARMRDIDVLARLGGDELGALLLNCPLKQALVIAEELRRTVQDFRFAWDDRIFDLGISIGIVEISETSVSQTALLVAADQACYLAKEQGRNRVHVYQETDSMVHQKKSELKWLTRVHEAFEKDFFRLWAMPIANLHDAGDLHCEILLRIERPSGELILPGRSFPQRSATI